MKLNEAIKLLPSTDRLFHAIEISKESNKEIERTITEIDQEVTGFLSLYGVNKNLHNCQTIVRMIFIVRYPNSGVQNMFTNMLERRIELWNTTLNGDEQYQPESIAWELCVGITALKNREKDKIVGNAKRIMEFLESNGFIDPDYAIE